MMQQKKFQIALGESFAVEVSLAFDQEELDVQEMDRETLNVYLTQLREHRDAMEDKEPSQRDHDGYLAWEEACDVLEDLIDDALDQLDEIEE